MNSDTIRKLQRYLLAWYEKNKRVLPWRTSPTLYRTLVAEFMLQQTRVDQALPYYHRFMKRFPTMRRLSSAPLADVVKSWEGLGYYRRADQLHRTAKAWTDKKVIPMQALDTYPGIGPYVAAAIGSIVWNYPMAVVDGNVKRVIARVLALPDDLSRPGGQAKIRQAADRWLMTPVAGDWNQAVMELGATVCTPRGPNCGSCPIRLMCRAYKSKRVDYFPKKMKRLLRPHRQWVAGVIRKGEQVVIQRRPRTGLLPNLWELPGGERRKNESHKDALDRAVRETLKLSIRVGAKIAEVDHGFSHFTITLHVFDCRYQGGHQRMPKKKSVRWVNPRLLSRYPFPRAQQSVIRRLAQRTSLVPLATTSKEAYAHL